MKRAHDLVQLAVAVILGLSGCAKSGEMEKPARGRDASVDRSDAAAPDAATDPGEPEAAGRSGAGASGRAGEGAEAGGGGAPGSAASGGPAEADGGGSAVDASGGSDAAMEAPSDAGVDAGAAAVRGKLIDFWRQPIGGVDVRIAGATARTNERGEFSLEAVARPYDASITFSVTYRTGLTRTYRWQFRGLTRDDPTLQVDEPPIAREARVEAMFSGVTFPLPEAQRLHYAFGSPNTMWSRVPSSSPAWTEGHVWFGPAVTTGMAHVLVWSVDDTPRALPVRYDMHAARALTLANGETAKPVLALAPQAIATGVITGRVTAAGASTNRRNHVFVRWSDNARIRIVEETPPTSAFSYVVPKLDNATITVAASSGEYSPGPFAVAHQALLSPDRDVALEIPIAPSLLAPADNAGNVGADTTFEWSGEKQVHVLCVENGTTEAIRVVTTESSARLPRTAAGDLALDPSRPYGFWVETHGKFESVDAAAEPSGFLDDYTPGIAGPMEHGEPFGPPRPAGVYAASASRRFTLAP